MQKLVVASNNKGKLKEIKAILGDKYSVVPMAELGFNAEIEENGVTFYDNALIKAKAVSLALGVDALADDSGLCVDALNGGPGVYSARFSGLGDDENNKKVLKLLEGETNRGANFTSSIVLYKPDGTIIAVEGKVYGTILHEITGSNGFGYDVIFYCTEIDKCFGLATPEEKNAVSHRARAIAKLKKYL